MPISSMTGFARFEGQYETLRWTWEVRSVNGKGLDVRCRIPQGYEGLDPAARTLIGKRLSRGNLSANLTLQTGDESAGYRINQEVLAQYLSAMKDVQAQVGEAQAPSIEALMGLKGVIEPIEDQLDEGQRKAQETAILKSLEDALASLVAHRQSEGERMAAVLADQVNEIERLCGLAEKSAATQPQALRAKLTGQLKAVLEDLPELDEERIAQEMAILITKADVREELDRLRAHIDGARELMAKGSPCGRKLDFLCQEFNREANTLCSKAQDVELTRIGLDFKATIDQFREQVQNIE